MANPLYGSEKYDGQVSQSYIDFVTGYQGNLTATGITATDAIMIAALAAGNAADILAGTLVNNAVNHMNDAHASAVNAVFLPEATQGAFLVCDYTQSPDGHASTHSYKCEGGTNVGAGNVFAKQAIGTINGATASSVETGGTNLVPTSKILHYTPAAATTNSLGPGSMVYFYCPVDGQWLVKVIEVAQGTGATGAWSVA